MALRVTAASWANRDAHGDAVMCVVTASADRDRSAGRLVRLPGSEIQPVGSAACTPAAAIGEWDINISAVRCPVLLWYGSDDRFAPPTHGLWLSQNLPQARLVLRDGEGHLGIYEHLGEMLDTLTEPDTVDTASDTMDTASTVRP